MLSGPTRKKNGQNQMNKVRRKDAVAVANPAALSGASPALQSHLFHFIPSDRSEFNTPAVDRH